MSKKPYSKIKLSKILVMGTLVRLISWPWTYHSDINITYWWGKFATEHKWRGFYDWLNFGGHKQPDQPMINIYYNWIVRQIYLFFYNIFWYLNVQVPIFPSKFMQWYFIEGNHHLLKLPMIIADLLIVYFCYKFTKSKKIALVLAFFPPLIYNSAVWGSGDSIVNLLGLLSLFFLWKKKYLPTIILYLFSILYKPSLLIWLPVILVILIKNKIRAINIILSGLFLLLLIFLISQPFNPAETPPLLWFFQTMTSKILPGAIEHITVNAMNLWGLMFGLKPTVDNFLIIKTINARLFSIIICTIFYIHEIIKLAKNYSFKHILLSVASLSMITFTFMTRMHERYSFPALIPLLLLSHYNPRLIKYFVILSITHMVNIYQVWQIPNIPPLISLIDNTFTIRLISFINVIVTLKLVFFNLQVKNTNSSQYQSPPPKSNQLII